MRNFTLLVATIVGSVLATTTGPAEEALRIPALDMAGGKAGWTAWTGSTAHPWQVLPEGGHAGRPALEIEARQHAHDVLVMTATDKLQAGQRYLVSSWESAGPRAGNTRIGFNPTHVAAFQAYLASRYGTIAELDRRWGSQYGSFAEIKPAAEPTLAPGEPVPIDNLVLVVRQGFATFAVLRRWN